MANIPNTALVLKATCVQEVSVGQLPNIYVLNDFLSDGQLEHLHNTCQCYVSFSHSEGAGMGAVEAAMRGKPVIIQEHGATKEYVKTPFLIPCTDVSVGSDDFLFKSEHMWGEPSVVHLEKYMRQVCAENVREWDHSYTRAEMDKIPLEIMTL